MINSDPEDCFRRSTPMIKIIPMLNQDYFQSQNIFGINFSTNYDTYSLFGKIDPGINLSIGRGSSNFTQVGLKTGSHFEIANSLLFNINMNYKLIT